PRRLEILGDGTQTKSYLYIEDAIEATRKTLETFRKENLPYDIYNIGSEDQINVKEIADIIVKEMNLKNVKYDYRPATKDGRGWPGDVKIMLLDITKIKEKTGWKPKLNSKEAVIKTVRNLSKNSI
ncbi:MAG: GDP-mannose 4,6-dehydratase, partial [archaeon GB-1845-036]|nr:GDP-mannose 4,6-dehydratase [Candidatus Culexmicrobium thermophilum]